MCFLTRQLSMRKLLLIKKETEEIETFSFVLLIPGVERVYVVVNFISQVIFIFPLFQLN